MLHCKQETRSGPASDRLTQAVEQEHAIHVMCMLTASHLAGIGVLVAALHP